MTRNRFMQWTALTTAFGMMATLTGCKPEESKRPKSQSEKGVITRIDPASKRLAMRVRHPQKSGQETEQTIEGTVTETTEIWIDGRAANVADLRVDDFVEATGHTQGKGDHSSYVAESIKLVARPEQPKSDSTQPPPAPPLVTISSPATASGPAAADVRTHAVQEPVNPETPVVTTAPPPMPLPPPGDNLAEKQAKLRMLLDEFRKQRQMAVDKRDALIKEGRKPDDPEVLKQENIIRKADEYIPYVEDIGASKGVPLPPEPAPAAATNPPASQPAAAGS